MALVFVGGLCCVVMTTWCPQAPRCGRRAAPAAAVRCHRGRGAVPLLDIMYWVAVELSPYVVPLCLVCLGCVLCLCGVFVMYCVFELAFVC